MLQLKQMANDLLYHFPDEAFSVMDSTDQQLGNSSPFKLSYFLENGFSGLSAQQQLDVCQQIAGNKFPGSGKVSVSKDFCC